MHNKILAHWPKSCVVEFRWIDEFPLAGELGRPDAFAGESVNWDILREQCGENVLFNHGTPIEWREVCTTI